MIRAYISSVSAQSVASPGETVAVRAFLGNAGDEEGYIIASLGYSLNGETEVLWTAWVWTIPGPLVQFDLSFIMPSHDTRVLVGAHSWDYSINAAREDAFYPEFTITIPYEAPTTPPEAFISGSVIPQEAQAGSTIRVESNLTNVGGEPDYFQLTFTYVYGQGSGVIASPWAWVEVGQTVSLGLDFSMPDMNTVVALQGEWWDSVNQTWVRSGNIYAQWINVIVEDLTYLVMPSWLKNTLEHNWANLEVGELLRLEILGIGLVVPPFPFTPGYWIRDSINWVIDGINWLNDGVRGVIGRVDDAWDSLISIGTWISDAFSWFNTEVSSWWSGTWASIEAWLTGVIYDLWAELERLGGVIDLWNTSLGDLAMAFEDFKGDYLRGILSWDVFVDLLEKVSRADDWILTIGSSILDFISDPAGWIFDRIDDWLNEEVPP